MSTTNGTDWETESDCNTLMRAQEIKSDPERHARAVAHARTKMQAMKQVAKGKQNNPEARITGLGYRKV